MTSRTSKRKTELPNKDNPAADPSPPEPLKQQPATTPDKSTGTPVVQHTPMTLPKVKKPKLGTLTSTVAKMKPPSAKHRRCVTTFGVRCGTTMATVTMADDSVAFNRKMSNYLREDPNRARGKHGVDRIHCMRDPKDPTKLWSQDTGRTTVDGKPIKRMKEFFMHIPEDEKEATLTFRRKFGEHLVSLHNAPAFLRSLYGSNNHAYYAGDLTPQGDLTYMSDHLTIKHTLDCIAFANCDRSLEDLVMNDEILSYYFPRHMYDEVREWYANFGKKPEDDTTLQLEEADEEAIPSLQF